MKSEKQNLTIGSPLQKILLFALPVIFGNLVQQMYNVVDTLIVGKALGVTKLAAVGAVGSMSFLGLGFVMGLTAGCAVLTSHAYGRSDYGYMKKSIFAQLIIAIAFTIILTALFVAVAAPLLRLMHTESNIFDDSLSYITIIYLGIGATMLYNFTSSVLRAIGNSTMPLVFLCIAAVLNIGLDLLFILTFHMDVEGAALATVISQLVSGLLCLGYILLKTDLFKFDRDSMHINLRDIMTHLKVGVPMGFQYSVIALGMLVLQYVLNGFGTSAVAAYTVGSKVQELVQSPLASISTVIATYVAQNYGAGNFRRIHKGVRECHIFGFILAVSIAVLVVAFMEPIISLFVSLDETETVEYAKEILLWACPLQFLLSILYVSRGALQGLGDGVTPMLGGVMELIMRAVVPLALSAALGFVSIAIAGPCAWVGCGGLMTVVYVVKVRKAEKKAKLANPQFKECLSYN